MKSWKANNYIAYLIILPCIGTQNRRIRMAKVRCTKCGKAGYLMNKQTTSMGYRYRYWHVKHIVGEKIKWCYIGKTLPPEYQELITDYGTQSTQNGTQRIVNPNNSHSQLFSRKQVGFKEPGMGIEPTYNSSAGCRLNRSATPAL